jgi:hypothetical protein
LRLALDFEISFGVCLSLFLLKEKVTKKFKDNPMAPPVCPANATDTLWLSGGFLLFHRFSVVGWRESVFSLGLVVIWGL